MAGDFTTVHYNRNFILSVFTLTRFHMYLACNYAVYERKRPLETTDCIYNYSDDAMASTFECINAAFQDHDK